jgi:Domain of unknown function (DUF4390)
MMVSFIPYCTRPDLFLQSGRICIALLVLLVTAFAFPATGSGAEEIRIKRASLDSKEGSYRLNTDFEVILNPTLERALEKGIVLYFATELTLTRPRWYWIDEKIALAREREALSYYALTRQYRLTRGTAFRSFSSLQEALGVLGQVRNRPIIAVATLQQDTTYTATLRVWLDISRLPKPFQLEAMGSKDWDISAKSLEWDIVPAFQPVSDKDGGS